MSLVIEHNVETGEIIEREQTADELKQAAKDAASILTEAAQKVQKQTAKAALLEKLGITEDEAKLLRG
jgi:hypothetical protein